MASFEKVLWALDREISPQNFERLCVDILCREGYRHIEPGGGTKDMGKDAELRFWNGKSDQFSVIAFQFSLEKNWEKKLCRDASKISGNFKNVSELVFVTTQRVTGSKKEKLKAEILKKHGWQFTVFDREWLRNRLCEFHQDIAAKYLGMDLPPTVSFSITQLELSDFNETSVGEIFEHTSPDLVRATIIERTRREPSIIIHWYNLARIDFLRRDYDGALQAIVHALELPSEDTVLRLNMELTKGVILAEKGIDSHSRPLLIQAKEIFTYVAEKMKRPEDLYNLANVLAALDETEQAGNLYAECVKQKPDFARAWKNFGSLFVEKRRPDWGIECFDKALAIDPNLVEAHLSKATALLLFCRKTKEAIQCFEAAYKLMQDLDGKWNYCRYWFSRALQLDGRLEEALKQAEIGLSLRPGDRYYLNQKGSILRSLRKRDSHYDEQALNFFRFRAHAIPADFAGLVEIIDICVKRGNSEQSWQLLDVNLPCSPLLLSQVAARSGLTIQDFKTAFEDASLYGVFRRDFSIEEHFVALKNAGLSPSKSILSALDYALMVPFVKMAAALRCARERKEAPPSEQLFTEALSVISVLFASFGGFLLARDKPPDRNAQIDLISRGMLCLIDMTATEGGRFMGYLAAKFEIPRDVLEKVWDLQWGKIRTEAAVKLLEVACKDWQLDTE